MRDYQVFRITSNGLEPMGSYQGRTGQQAIDKMAERGNLTGRNSGHYYHAIPHGPHFRKLKVKAPK